MVGTINSMGMGQLLYFICSIFFSLFRSNTVENFLTLSKAMVKIMNGVFGRIIIGGEGKSISRISVYSKKNKLLPFCDRSDGM